MSPRGRVHPAPAPLRRRPPLSNRATARRHKSLAAALCLSLAMALSIAMATLPFHPAAQACSSYAGCLVPPATGIQPCPDETSQLISKVCQNNFGSEGPSINSIYSGNAGNKVRATMPCVFYKALIYVESSWTMFCAACGSAGPTIIPTSCGFGYSQITWGMKASHGNISVNYDRNLVASNPTYNLATGLQFMADNWNMKPYFEGRDPEVIEHWYFAAWRYNNYVWSNNPNNPNYDANRIPLNCPGSGSASKYPYPERVWGFMKCPVTRNGKQLWTGIDVTYPDPAIFCNTVDCKPATGAPYPFRLPHHRDPCQRGEGGAPYDSTSDTDGDGVLDYLDCAPSDPRVHANAEEVCDGLDNDCDGTVDEGARCPEGASCQSGSCIADPVPPDAGADPEPVPGDAGAGDAGSLEDAGEPLPDAGDIPDAGDGCEAHEDCPDGNTCVKGRCLPDLEFDPLPEEGEREDPLAEQHIFLDLNSGCGCTTAEATPANLSFFLAFLVLTRRVRNGARRGG